MKVVLTQEFLADFRIDARASKMALNSELHETIFSALMLNECKYRSTLRSI